MRAVHHTASRAAGLAGRTARGVRRLARNTSGVSIVEFALALPILGTMTFYGLEIAYMATINMQVSQIALSVGDNASRLGQTDNSAVPPTVNEADIDAVLLGALQQGEAFDFQKNGRIILSSLERHPTSGKQYIHWQRCTGNLARVSSYGNDTTKNGINGAAITALGQPGHEVSAPSATQAVMFVEVYFSYEPLLEGLFVSSKDVEFKQEAALLVRDNRTLTSLNGTKKSSC